MPTPSLRTLLKAFGDADNIKEPLTRTQCKDLKDMLDAAATARDVELALEFANDVLKGHGVESIRDNGWRNHYWLDTGLAYVNMGDTYDTTLFYDTERSRFYVGSWGDYIESSRDLRKRFKES